MNKLEGSVEPYCSPKKCTKGIPAWHCVHLPKLGCAEPECDKVNKGMAVAVPDFQDALRDGLSLRNSVNLNCV